MTVPMPNAMRTYVVTTSLNEEITLSATSELEARSLFMRNFPRKRYASVREIEQQFADPTE